MKLKKIHLLLGLLVILVLLYGFSIFNLNKISSFFSTNSAKLSVIVISPNQDQCSGCYNTDKIVKFLDSSKEIKVIDKKIITSKDSNYNNLIEKNDIKNLPAVVISGDITNIKIAKIMKELNGKKINNNIVLQNLLPFYDIKTQKAKGLIKVVLLKDSLCSDCFNAAKYLDTLKSFGMKVATSSIYDISSQKGKSYVKKYKIKEVPALLMSPDANDYPGFGKSWKGVGTIEPDGWFIFREVQKTGGKFIKI